MGTEVENNRPNIRIQIVNNVAEGADEKMDVDVEQKENEEGEISDDKDNEEMSENVEPASSTKVKVFANILYAYIIHNWYILGLCWNQCSFHYGYQYI